MKKQLCISVDIESWIIAKSKVANISSYLSDCLQGLANSTSNHKEFEIREEIDAINNSINELNIKRSILQMELKRIEETTKQLELESSLKEQFKRWECPVCHKAKVLDTTYCDNCRANTRPKSEEQVKYVYINEKELKP